MKLISHRGNINGPNPELENTPDYIIQAISEGYHVEIDLWVIDSEVNEKGIFRRNIYLGHDNPERLIEFLLKYKDRLWCHAKNIKALELLLEIDMHTFWHQKDDYTITSNGYIWAYPGKMAKGILVMPENRFDTDFIWKNIYNIKGICSDHIKEYKEMFEILYDGFID